MHTHKAGGTDWRCNALDCPDTASKAETQKRRNIYGTLDGCDRHNKVDCARCPADSGGAARFECWTCAPPTNADMDYRRVSPGAYCYSLNHDVRPAEGRR